MKNTKEITLHSRTSISLEAWKWSFEIKSKEGWRRYATSIVTVRKTTMGWPGPCTMTSLREAFLQRYTVYSEESIPLKDVGFPGWDRERVKPNIFHRGILGSQKLSLSTNQVPSLLGQSKTNRSLSQSLSSTKRNIVTHLVFALLHTEKRVHTSLLGLTKSSTRKCWLKPRYWRDWNSLVWLVIVNQ